MQEWMCHTAGAGYVHASSRFPCFGPHCNSGLGLGGIADCKRPYDGGVMVALC